jgi:hypothetical protein
MRCRALAIITPLACLSYAGAGDAVAFSPQSHLAIPLVHRILPVKCTDAQKAACDELWTDEGYRKCLSTRPPSALTPPCFSPRMACYRRCGGPDLMDDDNIVSPLSFGPLYRGRQPRQNKPAPYRHQS